MSTFQNQVIAILPKLRVQALALTRNRSSAEDLVQDAVCNALSAQDSFIPGTNFPAWMHRILRNRFISNLRKRRDTTDIDDVPASAFATNAPHEDRLALKELDAAMTRLPLLERDLLIELLTGDIAPSALEQPAAANDLERAVERLFGPKAAVSRENLKLPPAPRLRDIYAALIDSDEFRAACGRISASYAW